MARQPTPAKSERIMQERQDFERAALHLRRVMSGIAVDAVRDLDREDLNAALGRGEQLRSLAAILDQLRWEAQR